MTISLVEKCFLMLEFVLRSMLVSCKILSGLLFGRLYFLMLSIYLSWVAFRCGWAFAYEKSGKTLS